MTSTLEMIISRIDELCAERNWTYYALTKEAHMNKNAINKIKNGKGLPSDAGKGAMHAAGIQTRLGGHAEERLIFGNFHTFTETRATG